MDLRRFIRTVPDWPKPGVQFRDITTLLVDPEGFTLAMNALVEHYKGMDFDRILAIESRGFIFGAALARELKKSLVLIRKPGKLPAKTVSEEYSLEYGKDKIEVHADAVKPGDKVIIMDDLMATGGTAMAAIHLAEKLGAKVVEAAFIIDLPEIGGSRKLKEAGYAMFHLIEFEGD